MNEMKARLIGALLLTTLGCSGSFAQRDIPFSENWLFVRDSVTGAETQKYDDSKWLKVDLPHDFSIMPLGEDNDDQTGPFSRESEGKNHTGHVKGGTGWYRKSFTLPAESNGKRVILDFDGAYMETDVWVNGKKAGEHKYGYTPFWFDITPYLNKPGRPNTIAVKVDNIGANSRWYSGSGLYRNVRLNVLDPVHIPQWGVSVSCNDISAEKANVGIEVSVDNDSGKTDMAELSIVIKDDKGKEIRRNVENVELASGNNVLKKDFSIDNPILWSPDTPGLYTAEVSLVRDGDTVDSYDQTFGIRSIEYSASKGFVLNGKPVLLKGGCLHHDNGFLGAAAVPRAEYRRVQLMKQNGYNAIRCSHNPPSREFLDACDQLGVMVIDEFTDMWTYYKNPCDYSRFFNDWWQKDLTDMLLRDRNHPSVVMWSIGNEIPMLSADEDNEMAQRLVAKVHEYDNSRPVTQGVPSFLIPGGWKNSHKYFSPLDICGYNYLPAKYEDDHTLYPDRIMYSSETYPLDAAKAWNQVETHPYVIGDFVWTAMDYIGEVALGHASYVKEKSDRQGLQDRDGIAEGTHPHKLFDIMNMLSGSKWPLYLSWCGDIDIIGDKKPQGLFRDVLWDRSVIEMNVHEPVSDGMVEEISSWGWPNEWPSWDWKGHEGETLQVRVFTKAPSVRLELNGNPIEEKTVEDDMTAVFNVPYQPGCLTAIAINRGNEAGRKTLVTPGKPVAVRMTADRGSVNADRNDLAFMALTLVDADGNTVTNDDRLLEISIDGNGEIVASGNAGQYGMKDMNRMKFHTFRGRAQVIVRPFNEKGKISVEAKSEGLPSQEIQVTTY